MCKFQKIPTLIIPNYFSDSSVRQPQNPYQRSTYTPTHIQNLLDVKKRARSLWEATTYLPHKQAYNKATHDLKKALMELHAEEKHNSLISLDAQDGSLWHKTKLLVKQPQSTPPLQLNNVWYSTPEEKARIFAEQLVDQFKPHNSELPLFHEQIVDEIAQPLQLTPFNEFFCPAQVKNAIQRSPTKKSPGCDRITQPLLKNMPRKTLVLLTQIFNAILRTTYYPSRWKHAQIIMILKPKKNARDPKSYRPISLVSIFSKIFERLMLSKLMPLFMDVIPNYQFGFRRSHSCPQQLHRLIEEILDTFEEQEICQGIFLDTEKAFDRVWHPGLLYKLKPLLPDTYYRIVQSFISNRTFHVKCDYAISASKNIISSVPQGSVWGPILYLIYVCDVPNPPNTTLAMFADDQAILSRASCGAEVTRKLQEHITMIEDWNKMAHIDEPPQKSNTTTFTYLQKELSHYPYHAEQHDSSTE